MLELLTSEEALTVFAWVPRLGLLGLWCFWTLLVSNEPLPRLGGGCLFLLALWVTVEGTAGQALVKGAACFFGLASMVCLVIWRDMRKQAAREIREAQAGAQPSVSPRI